MYERLIYLDYLVLPLRKSCDTDPNIPAVIYIISYLVLSLPLTQIHDNKLRQQ